MRFWFSAVLVAWCASNTSGQEPVVPRGFTIDTVAAGVYAVIRKESPGYILESNSLVIVGSQSVAVVDAQLTRTDTREVIEAIRRLTSKPVRYVINTHCHDDHVTGSVEYRDAFPGVDFVASKLMAEELDGICATNRASFRKQGLGTATFLRDLVGKNKSMLGGPLGDDERVAHLTAARLVEGFVAEAEPD